MNKQLNNQVNNQHTIKYRPDGLIKAAFCVIRINGKTHLTGYKSMISSNLILLNRCLTNMELIHPKYAIN